jgi:hypothetical protein
LLATPSDAGLEGEYWPGPALRPISRPEDARTAFLKRKHAPLVRHKKPGSRIVPKGRKSPQSVREAVAGLRRLQKQIAAREKGKPEMTWQEFKSSVEEGRP